MSYTVGSSESLRPYYSPILTLSGVSWVLVKIGDTLPDAGGQCSEAVMFADVETCL